ncbi:MAG: M1 family metallopeptidase [Candidatus Saccharibacteria bacterium]
MSKTVRRLYDQFQPEHYDLSLVPDRANMTFQGSVVIRGKKTGRPSRRLTFHQKDLTITAATVTRHDKKGDQDFPISRLNNQDSFDEVRLHAAEQLYPGSYSVTLTFIGKITRQMNGIYPCFFTEDGVEKQLIATQFESHHAREAFPCIDEPEAKATFDLTLTSPKGEAVVANTPILSQSTTGASSLTRFATTPRMSTYLLAFAYGELAFQEATTKDGVVVRTYATAANVAHTRFALDVAVRCLEFYNEYFGVPYPLPKCDFIALPDFASGAMENWGCITFREQALLVDDKNTSLHLKQYVANVVAHELTHQWFGNLVTMRWWTDLWLNESFASWMSYLAVDELFPDWKVWTQFIVDEQSIALKLDALDNTHPIQVTVNHPDEIRTIFDAISYEKGASVLHMLHNYLGPDDFRDGLRLYLQQHAYGNTDSTDLWTAWEEASHKPVSDFMGTWTAQPGYPIVHATVGQDSLELTQERFYLNPDAPKQAAIWPVPLLASESIVTETLNTAEESVLTTGLQADFLLNRDRTGFYRAVYDSAHLASLATAIAAGRMSELDRLGLLADSFEAAKAGYGNSVDALQLLEAFRHEDSVVVWDVIAAGLASIRSIMNDEDLRTAMKPFVRHLVAEQLARLGWDESPHDSHFDKLLRPTILGLASYGEEPSVVAEATRRFSAMTKPADVHPDLRGVVYGTVSRLGGLAEFDKLLGMHNNSASSEDRVTLSAALTNFRQPELISRALDQIASRDVRLQDAAYWIAYSFTNHHARNATWDWMTIHWAWLNETMGNDLSFFRMPNFAARAYSDASFLPTYIEFFSQNLSPAFDRPFKQGVETIQWQAAWRARDLALVKSYFKA